MIKATCGIILAGLVVAADAADWLPGTDWETILFTGGGFFLGGLWLLKAARRTPSRSFMFTAYRPARVVPLDTGRGDYVRSGAASPRQSRL